MTRADIAVAIREVEEHAARQRSHVEALAAAGQPVAEAQALLDFYEQDVRVMRADLEQAGQPGGASSERVETDRSRGR